MSLLRRLLPTPRVILDRNGKDPYITRWMLLRTSWLRVFVHRIHRGDYAEELHNHPWSWAASLILKGGYVEERRQADDTVTSFRCLPGSINVIRSDTFHRLDLINGDCWTLFVAGRREKNWGFWGRTDGQFQDWQDYVAAFPWRSK